MIGNRAKGSSKLASRRINFLGGKRATKTDEKVFVQEEDVFYDYSCIWSLKMTNMLLTKEN